MKGVGGIIGDNFPEFKKLYDKAVADGDEISVDSTNWVDIVQRTMIPYRVNAKYWAALTTLFASNGLFLPDTDDPEVIATLCALSGRTFYVFVREGLVEGRSRLQFAFLEDGEITYQPI